MGSMPLGLNRNTERGSYGLLLGCLGGLSSRFVGGWFGDV